MTNLTNVWEFDISMTIFNMIISKKLREMPDWKQSFFMKKTAICSDTLHHQAFVVRCGFSKIHMRQGPVIIFWYQIITPLCGHSAFGAEGAKALMFLDSSGVKWNFSIKGHRTQTIICHEFCWTFAALKCLNWSNIWIMEFQDLLFHFLWIMSSFWRLFFYVFMGKKYIYIF